MIISQGGKHGLIPRIQEAVKLSHFYNCVATLMTEQLQNLTLDSLTHYTELFVRPLVS